jgi:hypothetical protein
LFWRDVFLVQEMALVGGGNGFIFHDS